MATNHAAHALPRSMLLLLAGLMLLSTLLFVIGIALERAGSTEEAHPPLPQASTTAAAEPAAPEGSEAREAQERQTASTAQAGAEGAAAHEQAEQSSVFGIDLESPWVIAGVVLGTLLLIGALFLFGQRALLLVLVVTLVATLFDVREVVFQLGQARYGIAGLAIGVALSHLATAIVALLALRKRRNTARPPATVAY
jgi:uncharacterized membrane protein YeiB